ncbi:MAG: DNA-binding protein [Chitinivibrionales bacterium]|nr:DNA-binding protein [Chitinivibrionales bacterium]
MNIIPYKGPTEIIALGFAPGEMLLESLRDALDRLKIKNGAVISGIGTLKTCRMHYVMHTDFPPTDRVFTLNKPLELLSVNGLIADGEPHLHIVVSCAEEPAWGGHLEEGCEVLYLAEIAVMAWSDLRLQRTLDTVRKIKLLEKA